MGEKPNHKAEIKAKMKNIDISDGVGKEEAVILAQNYLLDNGLDNLLVTSKPSVENSSIKEGYWLIIFPTIKSVRSTQGLEWGSFRVDKKTGKVVYLGEGPS